MNGTAQLALIDITLDRHGRNALCGPVTGSGTEVAPGATWTPGRPAAPLLDVLACRREADDLRAAVEWGGLSRAAAAAALWRAGMLEAGLLPPQASIDDYLCDTPG